MVLRILVCLVLFGLAGCSQEAVVTKIADAQNKPTADNSTPKVEPKVESTVKVIGDFSNVKSDGEHESGYSVALWRQDDKIYGLMSGGDDLRLSGDSPLGLLENADFDPKTDKLSFRAKMPMQIVYEFEGVLAGEKLQGFIKVTDVLCGAKCLEPKKITLPLSKDMTSTMEDCQSFAEWEARYRETLKRRGPKS